MTKEDKIAHMRETMRNGLNGISQNSAGTWLDEYSTWRSEKEGSFDSLLIITNPFNLSEAGDREFFDPSDKYAMVDLDTIAMAVFCWKKLLEYEKSIVNQVRNMRNRESKLKVIKEYFDFIDTYIENVDLSPCVVILNDFAEKQTVLYGAHPIDLYTACYSLLEILRKNSIESIYLLFTAWRISNEKKYLKKAISSIVEYIRAYYQDFDRDPEMHLSYSMDGLSTIKKLGVIQHWLEKIAFHTNGIFEKYIELDWLTATDTMADNVIATNQISRYEMLSYKRIFQSDDEDTVRKKATCNHGYGVWIKTADIMCIVCDICRIIHNYTDADLKKILATRPMTLELYDNMLKVRDYYTGKIFFHRAYYQNSRKYIDSQIMEALEDDDKVLSDSFDELLCITEAIASDNIEELLQAKRRYIESLTGRLTPEQETALDEKMEMVVDRIREKIQKTAVYDELYASISKDFLPYAVQLMRYPSILSSLVSAEYLYQQYVEHSEDNPRFDYSCISIMYYMSLEEFANKLVYIPYNTAVLSGVQQSDWRRYVSSATAFWDKKNGAYKASCEIGNLGYLFNNIYREREFERYLSQSFANIDLIKLRDFGQKLINIAPRRNDAAHGGNMLSYTTVKQDKSNVYETVITQYRGLILELLEILF